MCYFDFNIKEYPPNAKFEEKLYIFYATISQLIDISSAVTKLWDSLAESEQTKVRSVVAVLDKIVAINANYEGLKKNGLL